MSCFKVNLSGRRYSGRTPSLLDDNSEEARLLAFQLEMLNNRLIQFSADWK